MQEVYCYPDATWAQFLIEAHRQPWAAVGPAICNANPNSLVSWADALVNGSNWVEPSQAGVADDLPGRNSSYKRALLLEYGSRLEDMLETEYVMHQDLKSRGYQLYIEPAARTPFQFHALEFSDTRAVFRRANAGRDALLEPVFTIEKFAF